MKLTQEAFLQQMDDMEFIDGDATKWLSLAWEHLDKRGMFDYNTVKGKIKAYTHAYNLVVFYAQFCAVEYGYPTEVQDVSIRPDFSDVAEQDSEQLYFPDVLDNHDLDDFIIYLITNEEELMESVSAVLDGMKFDNLHAALYYAAHMDRYIIHDWEDDEFYEDCNRDSGEYQHYLERLFIQENFGDRCFFDTIRHDSVFSPGYTWLSEML